MDNLKLFIYLFILFCFVYFKFFFFFFSNKTEKLPDLSTSQAPKASNRKKDPSKRVTMVVMAPQNVRATVVYSPGLFEKEVMKKKKKKKGKMNWKGKDIWKGN